MILSVVGPGEGELAPTTVTSRRFGPRRPSAVADGIGTAGALVERTQYATFNDKTAIVRVALTQESARSATAACRRAASTGGGSRAPASCGSGRLRCRAMSALLSRLSTAPILTRGI